MSMATTGSGLCIANLHASTGARAADDVLKAARIAAGWADGAPLVLGGDFNLRPASSDVFERLHELHGLAGVTDPRSIDHILGSGVATVEPAAAWPDERRDVPDPDTGMKLRLSDHRPVVCRVST
jgi:hypothetical protein